MAAPRNTRSISQLFEGWRENLQGWLLARPRAIYESLHYKLHHLPQTNFDLGCNFAAAGKLQDAVFRFKIALYLQPDYIPAHYHLGCCYLRLNKRALARQSFLRTLKLAPTHAEALFMLSALDPASLAPAQRPTRMPHGMVQDFFNGLAGEYDAIEAANQYKGGHVCVEALKPLLEGKTELRIIDLGCGTGLAVRPLRAAAADITGIEFAPAIVQSARGVKAGDRPAFDTVLEEDLADLAHTKAALGEADITVCCNVAQFLGDLQPMLAVLGQKLKPGAVLLLTVEPFNTPAGFAVNIDTGRFGHHPDYVKKIAAGAGLGLTNEARVNLYPNIAAQLFLFTKAAA